MRGYYLFVGPVSSVGGRKPEFIVHNRMIDSSSSSLDYCWSPGWKYRSNVGLHVSSPLTLHTKEVKKKCTWSNGPQVKANSP